MLQSRNEVGSIPTAHNGFGISQVAVLVAKDMAQSYQGNSLVPNDRDTVKSAETEANGYFQRIFTAALSIQDAMLLFRQVRSYQLDVFHFLLRIYHICLLSLAEE